MFIRFELAWFDASLQYFLIKCTAQGFKVKYFVNSKSPLYLDL